MNKKYDRRIDLGGGEDDNTDVGGAGKRRVMNAMILDDDPLVRSLVGNVFCRMGYRVMSYSNPVECPLFTAKGCPCNISVPCPDVILSDYDMPGVNGVEFFETIVRFGCKCSCLALMSGSTIPKNYLERAVKLQLKLIAKPFHADQIKSWLDEIEPVLRHHAARHGAAM